MKRPRLPFAPLFGQILGWFFLNLLALAAGLVLTIHLQGAAGSHWFPGDPAPAQTQAMAVELMGQLGSTPRAEWDALLAKTGAQLGMRFALYGRDALRVAGAPLELPEPVRTTARMVGIARPTPPPVAAPARGEVLPDFPRHVIRSGSPPAYWLLVHLPLDRLAGAAIDPLLLVGEADSLDSPLLFNPTPWLVVAVGLALFSALFWLPLVQGLTAAIAQMTRATEAIAAGRFDVHADDSRRDELGRLGLAINRMAQRLEGFITGQRRFLGDVSHELSSPLARMELALGILEARCDPEDAKGLGYVRDVAEEVSQMRQLTHELLCFSKATLAGPRLELQRVRLAEVAAAAARRERVGPPKLALDVPAELAAAGDAELLARAIGNLVRNGLRYGGDAGPISVTAWAEASAVILAVRDEGPGVPPALLERLFEPFYRLDTARTRETGGAGLGLAIVKSCVEACGGSVLAKNLEPRGFEVQLRLRAPPDP